MMRMDGWMMDDDDDANGGGGDGDGDDYDDVVDDDDDGDCEGDDDDDDDNDDDDDDHDNAAQHLFVLHTPMRVPLAASPTQGPNAASTPGQPALLSIPCSMAHCGYSPHTSYWDAFQLTSMGSFKDLC